MNMPPLLVYAESHKAGLMPSIQYLQTNQSEYDMKWLI